MVNLLSPNMSSLTKEKKSAVEIQILLEKSGKQVNKDKIMIQKNGLK